MNTVGGFHCCEECRTPFQPEDLVAIYGGQMQETFLYHLCRWHADRLRERLAKAS